MAGDLENSREALVQKIGENISVRRISQLEGGNVGGYVHSNGKIASLVSLTAGEQEVAPECDGGALHECAAYPSKPSG